MVAGWCAPNLHFFRDKALKKGKLKAGLTMKSTIQEVALVVTSTRNPIGHKMILDIDFHEKSLQLQEVAAAVGGDVSGVKRLCTEASEWFPAQNTADEVRQYEAEYRDETKLFTMEQCEVHRWIGHQEPGCCKLLPGASGTVKSLIIIKHAADFLLRKQKDSQENPGVHTPPLLVLAPSIALQEHLSDSVLQDLGSDCLLATWLEDPIATIRQNGHEGVLTIRLPQC